MTGVRSLEFDHSISHENGASNERRRALGCERYDFRLFHKTYFDMLIDLQTVLAGKRKAEGDAQ